MVLNVTPDPERPHGGYALISGPADRIGNQPVTVSIFDAFSERYLGAQDWQGAKAEFGPYPVEVKGDIAHVVIGPEIVNQIEEYAVVDITVGAVSAQIPWPDSVFARAGAAVLGGIRAAGAAAAAKPSNLMGKAKAEVEEPDPDHDPSPDIDEEAGEDRAREGGTSRLPLLAGLGLLALAIIGAAAWFVMQPGEDLATPEPAPVPAPATAPASAPEVAGVCSDSALRALRGAFADTATVLTGCGAATNPDVALTVVENAAALGDPDALLLFGALYDGAVETPVIEDQIGLTFGDDPSRAAEYYSRARDAGAAAAQGRLDGVCARLGLLGDTLSQGAFDDYCS